MNIADALAWARERNLSASDTPNYLREYEHLTLARVLLASRPRDGEAGRVQRTRGERTADCFTKGGSGERSARR